MSESLPNFPTPLLLAMIGFSAFLAMALFTSKNIGDAKLERLSNALQIGTMVSSSATVLVFILFWPQVNREIRSIFVPRPTALVTTLATSTPSPSPTQADPQPSPNVVTPAVTPEPPTPLPSLPTPTNTAPPTSTNTARPTATNTAAATNTLRPADTSTPLAAAPTPADSFTTAANSSSAQVPSPTDPKDGSDYVYPDVPVLRWTGGPLGSGEHYLLKMVHGGGTDFRVLDETEWSLEIWLLDTQPVDHWFRWQVGICQNGHVGAYDNFTVTSCAADVLFSEVSRFSWTPPQPDSPLK